MTVARPITPDLAALDGVHIVPTTEPRIGAPLGIELRHLWRDDVARGIEPTGLAEQKRQIEEDS